MVTLVQIYENITSPSEYGDSYSYEVERYGDSPVVEESILHQSILFDTEAEADAFIADFGSPVIPVTDNHPDVYSFFTAWKASVTHNAPVTAMYEVHVKDGEIVVEAKLVPTERVANTAVLSMAKQNPGKVFMEIFDGAVVELENDNGRLADTEETGWSSDVEWLIELQRESGY